MRLLPLTAAALIAAMIQPATLAAATLDDGLVELLRGAYALPGAEMTVDIRLDAPIPEQLQAFGDQARFANLVFDRSSGRFTVTALLPAGANGTSQLPLSGQVAATVEVPILRDSVRRGDLVTADLVDYALIPANRLSGDYVLDIADLAGQAARRTLHPNRPIRSADLMPPIVVPKNKLVSMIYESGAMRVTARGRAMDDGGAGDTITVLNTDSKRTVEAVIVDSETVSVVAKKP
jgi:flagella basal body P-ring formation protein FlgA